jgi:alpha-mannosidase
MHRWVDLSEPDFGVALINDCKYGYDVRGSTLRLTVLKSPTYPWPEADQGEHRFRYALVVHEGLLTDDVPGQAEAYNLPLRLVPGAASAPVASDPLFRLDGQGVTLEAVKNSNAGDGIVLRLWETHGRSGEAVLHLPAAISRAEIVNLLERAPRAVAIEEGCLRLAFTPFQIVTLKLTTRSAEEEK